jgi:TM2 domain-containing membrane protein YozV
MLVMPKDSTAQDAGDQIQVQLRQPGWAALWAWLWPGAGHFYQGRYAKGTLFMVCILTTYFFGLAIGGGHVVYASWTEGDKRWQYFCQLGVGIPAFPAILQARRANSGDDSLFGGLMAPPQGPVLLNAEDELARWHHDYHFFFELGTLYTMIAGLLNVLAVYDAWGGPVMMAAADDSQKRAPPGLEGNRTSYRGDS